MENNTKGNGMRAKWRDWAILLGLMVENIKENTN